MTSEIALRGSCSARKPVQYLRGSWCGLSIGFAVAACGGNGKHDTSASPVAPAKSSPAPPSNGGSTVEVPLELVQQPLTVQAVKGYVAFLASTPRDWPLQDLGGAKVARDPDPGSPSAITIIFKPFVLVKDLPAAEQKLEELDSIGQEKIAEKRELGAGRFLISTAPRGSGKLVTVNVITSGKRTAVLAKCASTLAREVELEKICSSVVLQEGIVPPPVGVDPPKRRRGT
jgi:hypothetical protein